MISLFGVQHIKLCHRKEASATRSTHGTAAPTPGDETNGTIDKTLTLHEEWREMLDDANNSTENESVLRRVSYWIKKYPYSRKTVRDDDREYNERQDIDETTKPSSCRPLSSPKDRYGPPPGNLVRRTSREIARVRNRTIREKMYRISTDSAISRLSLHPTPESLRLEKSRRKEKQAELSTSSFESRSQY